MGGCLSVSGGASNTVNADGTLAREPAAARPMGSRAPSGAEPSSALQGLPHRQASTGAPPPRLAIKGEMLARTLEKARAEGLRGPLVDLAAHTVEELNANRQPTPRMTRLDIASLPALAGAYNQRHDGLDLQVMERPSELIDALETLEPGRSLRAVVRLAENGVHHVAVDARGHADGTNTVMVMEPAVVASLRHLPGYIDLRRQSIEKMGERSRWVFIENEAQKSLNDCLPFSFHLALCAHRNSRLFDTWHDRLNENGALGEPHDTSNRFAPLAIPGAASAGIEVLVGKKFLPAEFFKHLQSVQDLELLAQLQPGITGENVRSSSRVDAKESIAERRAQFKVTRGGVRTMEYSASIEGARATKVRVALEAELRTLRGE